MFLRLYLLGKFVRNHSGYYGPQASLLGSRLRVRASEPWFNFKAFYTQSSGLIAVCALLVDWVGTSIAVRILERPANLDLESFSNALYLTIITMSTVGYGEISPITIGGQVVMIIGGIIGGVLVLSMMTAIVIETLQLSGRGSVYGLNFFLSHFASPFPFNHATCFRILNQRKKRGFLKRTTSFVPTARSAWRRQHHCNVRGRCTS